MPAFLKKDAIRLIEAAKEFYVQSLYNISLPRLLKNRSEESRYAPASGLLGAAVELSIKCCLVQAKGIRSIFKGETGYKQASECLEEFRRCMRDKDKSFDFLWKSEQDIDQYINSIKDCLQNFKMLIEIRAAGLHNGYGPSYDAMLVKIDDIYKFLKLLEKSKKLNPYLRPLPRPIQSGIDRFALIKDLNAKIADNSDQKEKARYLHDLYLVLPYIPDEMPDWLGALNRIQIAPKKNDIVYLVKNLSKANTVYLYKDDRDGNAISAKIEKGNPDAIPIEPQFLKKSFHSTIDVIKAQAALANGRFDKDFFEPPSFQNTLDLFVYGISTTTIGTEPGALTAQDAWPFVAASLNASGTTYPIWFVVSACKEKNKLFSMLQKATAMRCATKIYKNNFRKLEPVFQAIKEKRCSDELLESMYVEADSILKKTPLYIKDLKNMNKSKFPEEINTSISQYITRGIGLSEMFSKIVSHQFTGRDGLLRKVLSCATHIDDIESLIMVLRSNECTQSLKTIIRKNLRALDIIRCEFFQMPAF